MENWDRSKRVLKTGLSIDLEIHIAEPSAEVLPFEREQPSKLQRSGNGGVNMLPHLAAIPAGHPPICMEMSGVDSMAAPVFTRNLVGRFWNTTLTPPPDPQ